MDPLEFSRQVANRTARTPRKLGQAPYRTLQLAAAEPGETPYDVVYEEPPIRLRRYEPEGDEVHDVPVVIAYAFINDPSILDFSPDRSIVGTFLERGVPSTSSTGAIPHRSIGRSASGTTSRDFS